MTLELQQDGPCSMRVIADGRALRGYALNFMEDRVPTEKQQQDYLDGLRRMAEAGKIVLENDEPAP